MKIQSIIATLLLSFVGIARMAHAEMSTSESYDIRCLSEACHSMSDEQMNKIDRVIEDQLRERISDKNFLGKSKSVVVLNKTAAIDLIHKAEANTKTETDVLGLSKMKKKDLMEMERTDTFMAFRVSPMENKHNYLAANVYMDRDYLRKENDPEAYHVKMNTIGFGSQIRDGWIVEIGLIKAINAKAALNKFNPAPDGLLLTFKKQL